MWSTSQVNEYRQPWAVVYLRGNIIRTALCWIVWHNVDSPQHTYMSSSYRSNRLGLSYWDPYTVHIGGCLELYYCNMVWFKPDLWRPSGFLQCFDTVGLVIWPVKIVPEMTYNVSSGTLNPTHSLTHCCDSYCDIQTALSSAVTAVPRSTRPPILNGMLKQVSAFRLCLWWVQMVASRLVISDTIWCCSRFSKSTLPVTMLWWWLFS